jgi:hypothetical protein
MHPQKLVMTRIEVSFSIECITKDLKALGNFLNSTHWALKGCERALK